MHKTKRRKIDSPSSDEEIVWGSGAPIDIIRQIMKKVTARPIDGENYNYKGKDLIMHYKNQKQKNLQYRIRM